MTDMPHELPEEFPEYAEKMEALRANDGAFAKLYDDYHEVNRKVLEAETLERPTDHFHEEEMKKERAHLKDEIYKALTA
ncbi:YdcH family protein [Sinisalibacter lacisalsi]|uniref:DUF465 domain-containing protein n=1 Tax=Sinisalibacter lacisalsi TaxID=1526570 RepID=A0ABQ1QGE3_9RHOB|nr:DUF465 domain-containing protein [Sinisalibacter lacisalsi]GGD26896.1 hypothetical protein GCM10011358_09030 [Sinisalibacter lacisalsi]